MWSFLALQELGQVLAPIIKNFYEVMNCVSTSQTAVTQLVTSMKSFHELFKLCWSDEFLQTFERYSYRWLRIQSINNSPGANAVKNFVFILNVYFDYNLCV